MRGDDYAGHARGPLGQRELDARQAVAVGGDDPELRFAVAFGGMDVDPVEIVAGLLGRHREPGTVDDVAQRIGGDGEGVRQLALAHRREILARQGGEGNPRTPAAHHQLVLLAAAGDLEFGALRQLANDIEQRLRGHRGRTGLGDGAGHPLDDGDIHVGRG